MMKLEKGWFSARDGDADDIVLVSPSERRSISALEARSARA